MSLNTREDMTNTRPKLINEHEAMRDIAHAERRQLADHRRGMELRHDDARDLRRITARRRRRRMNAGVDVGERVQRLPEHPRERRNRPRQTSRLQRAVFGHHLNL